MLGSLLERIREAGAYRERDTERDGFLSYAGETHSVGYGLGLGLAIALKLAGIPFVLEVVLLALGGIGAGRRFNNERVMREITDEPQYFLPAILLGFVPTAVLCVLLGATLIIPF